MKIKEGKLEQLKKHPLRLPDDRVMTYSERKDQLDKARFIDIRVLVHNLYEKPDGSPFMEYKETLDDREGVKRRLLEYELNDGDILADGTEQAAAPVAAAPEKTGEEMQPFQPIVAPTHVSNVAGTTTTGADNGSVPTEQPQPTPVAGRARRRPGTSGVAVAPPPGTGASSEVSTPVAAVQSFTPTAATTTTAVPAPVAFQSAPGPSMAGPAAVQSPSAVGQGMDMGLGPVLERLDTIGKMVADIGNAGSKTDEKLNTLAGSLSEEILKLKNNQMAILTILHHTYLTNPALMASVPKELVESGKINLLPEFLAYLAPFYAGVPR